MVNAVVGGNWGDEGKGKMTDLLASDADIVVRYQGGANAGHTIMNDYGKFVLHLLPSGVFHKNVVNVIADSVAFDPDVFFEELDMLNANHLPKPNIKVSFRTQLLLPFHKMQDALEEKRLGDEKFGSTQSGIAPFYSDKYLKKNIQISELYSDNLYKKAACFLEDKKIYFRAFYDVDLKISVSDFYKYLICLKDKLKPYLIDCSYYLNQQFNRNKTILLEGQLGALRDMDNGIYPFVTSSSPLAGFATVSTGLSPHSINRIITVVKAYSSCIGEGPFVTEIFGRDAEILRKNGGDSGEYGAKTGRPRRMGWFDCVATRYGCMLQGATEISLSLLDVLGYLDSIPVCTGYKIGDKILYEFPDTHTLYHAEPVYEYLPGWKCDISNITEYHNLPSQAKNYIEFIEQKLQLPITMISNGPKREQIIHRTAKI